MATSETERGKELEREGEVWMGNSARSPKIKT